MRATICYNHAALQEKGPWGEGTFSTLRLLGDRCSLRVVRWWPAVLKTWNVYVRYPLRRPHPRWRAWVGILFSYFIFLNFKKFTPVFYRSESNINIELSKSRGKVHIMEGLIWIYWYAVQEDILTWCKIRQFDRYQARIVDITTRSSLRNLFHIAQSYGAWLYNT